MTQRLSGRAALVTGGGGGIGRATALAFAREGARVCVADIDAAAAAATADAITAGGGEAFGLAADVRHGDQVSRMVAQAVARFGRLDIAFNNAGIEIETGPLVRGDDEIYQRLMDVNVKGVWLCMKHELAHMLDRPGGGAIINTASVAGLVGAPGRALYAASKHAVLGMTKSAAVENGRKGIRINAVCPGVIRTDMMARAVERRPDHEPLMAAMHPIGRVGEAEEIANAVVFLASDDAAFVLGHALTVDGGMTVI